MHSGPEPTFPNFWMNLVQNLQNLHKIPSDLEDFWRESQKPGKKGSIPSVSGFAAANHRLFLTESQAGQKTFFPRPPSDLCSTTSRPSSTRCAPSFRAHALVERRANESHSPSTGLYITIGLRRAAAGDSAESGAARAPAAGDSGGVYGGEGGGAALV